MLGGVQRRAMLIWVSRRRDVLGCHLGRQTWGDNQVHRLVQRVPPSWIEWAIFPISVVIISVSKDVSPAVTELVPE
jgi:hypothetical protein